MANMKIQQYRHKFGQTSMILRISSFAIALYSPQGIHAPSYGILHVLLYRTDMSTKLPTRNCLDT